MIRVVPSASATPATIAAAVSSMPWRTTSHCTCVALAPSAIQVPISRMLRRASWATMP